MSSDLPKNFLNDGENLSRQKPVRDIPQSLLLSKYSHIDHCINQSINYLCIELITILENISQEIHLILKIELAMLMMEQEI